MTVDRSWTELNLEVRPPILPGPSLMELRYSRTARPAETVDGSADRRQLAIAVDRISLTPVRLAGKKSAGDAA